MRIGDPVTLELGYQEMRNDLANSPAMDNKTGLWVCIEALRRVPAAKKLNVALYAVSTVQEEIGLRGAQTSAYRHRPAGRHRRRRDARHRLPDDRQEGRRRHRAGRRPGDLSRAEHEPDRRRAADSTRPRATRFRYQLAASGGRRAPTPTPSRSTAPAWRRAWSAFPTATCTARSR